MKFTLEWLLSHLDVECSIDELSEKLTTIGIEVEDICDCAAKFSGIFVGKIKECCKHPDADRLSLCKVDVGDKNSEKLLQIVCGAPNVRQGLTVAVALVGTVIPVTGLELKAGKIRGITSEAMMCSAYELQLGIDHNGILELDDNFIVGMPFADALNLRDIIFDVSITPNKADCCSVRGIARALSCYGFGKLKPLLYQNVVATEKNTTNVTMETEKCHYFSYRPIFNIQDAVTPDFIAKRLNAVGQKLISATVDIANYICLDIGQPMHIFDLDKLPQNFVVRNSIKNEEIDALNGKTEKIPENSVIVGDNDAFSVAGIIGGIKTAVSQDTRNILIESACFDKVTISLTSQQMRLHTDSSYRNSRGVDPDAAVTAMEYATYLLSKCSTCSVGDIKSIGKLPDNTHKITITRKKFCNLTGLTEKDWQYVPKILRTLQFEIIAENSTSIDIITPSYRYDLEIEEDIIEEILVMLGYNTIESVELPKKNPIISQNTCDVISDILLSNGLSEIKTFSFVDEKICNFFECDNEKWVKLETPLTTEFAVMRTTPMASIIKVLKLYYDNKHVNTKFFEIGKRFCKLENKIIERNTLTIAVMGSQNGRNWAEHKKNVDVFYVKSILERVFAGIGIANYRIKNGTNLQYYHPGQSGSYIIKKDDCLATFGALHPNILSQFNIKVPIICADIYLEHIDSTVKNCVKLPQSLPQYHPIMRDFSFVVSAEITASDIIDSIKKAHIDMISNINIFDIYMLENEQKAVGVEITIQPKKVTLTDVQIEEISNKITKNVCNNCNAILRK